MNNKKTFSHHSPDAAASPSAIWLKIVYAGFALLIVSIAFHTWLFMSSGNISASSASASASSAAPIDGEKLNAVVSAYLGNQAQKISQASADAGLSDPSK